MLHHLLLLFLYAEADADAGADISSSSSATSSSAPTNSSSGFSTGWWDMLVFPSTQSVTLVVVSAVFLLVLSGKLRFKGFPAVNANQARRNQQQRRSPANSEEESEDDNRKRTGKKKATNNNLNDSDSQVADDEEEMTNPEETPFGTPSIANASVLSRRQKKNRKHVAADALSRDAEANEGGESSRPAHVNHPDNGGYISSSNSSKAKKKGRRNYAADKFAKLNLTEEEIYGHIKYYVLNPADLALNSYPLESTEGLSLAYILQQVSDPPTATRSEELDLQFPELNPNAQVFTPRGAKNRKEESKNSKKSDERNSNVPSSHQLESSTLAEENCKLPSSASSHTLRPTAEEFIPKRCYQQSKDQVINSLNSGSGVDLMVIEGSGDPIEPLLSEEARVSDDEIELPLNEAAAGGSGDRFESLSSQKHDSSQIGCDSTGAVADKSTETRDEDAKECLRCNKIFYVSHTGVYLTQEQCRYHHGKFKKGFYICCPDKRKRGVNEPGCSYANLHVWKGLSRNVRKTYVKDCVVTKMPKKFGCGVNAVYALDSEMAFTAFGLELVRISVVGVDGRKVYEAYVNPESAVIDYNTRFSGITSSCLEGDGTKTLREVQNDLMGFINAHTILIGHGLENDLRVLKLVHLNVIDTAILFMDNPSYKPSLRSLAKRYLKRDIQTNPGQGHDSLEDAEACMELVLVKLMDDIASQDQ